MNNALKRCGFNSQTIQYVINHGFASPADLLLASESDLDSIACSVARNLPRGPGGNQVTMPFIRRPTTRSLTATRQKLSQSQKRSLISSRESLTQSKNPQCPSYSATLKCSMASRCANSNCPRQWRIGRHLRRAWTAIYWVFRAQATKPGEGRKILGSYQRTSNSRICTTPHGYIAS